MTKQFCGLAMLRRRAENILFKLNFLRPSQSHGVMFGQYDGLAARRIVNVMGDGSIAQRILITSIRS